MGALADALLEHGTPNGKPGELLFSISWCTLPLHVYVQAVLETLDQIGKPGELVSSISWGTFPL